MFKEGEVLDLINQYTLRRVYKLVRWRLGIFDLIRTIEWSEILKMLSHDKSKRVLDVALGKARARYPRSKAIREPK